MSDAILWWDTASAQTVESRIMSRFVILGWLLSLPIIGAILLAAGYTAKAIITKAYVGSNIVFFLLWFVDLFLRWRNKQK